jgi:tetratricopeptide (TPR) repeat protein
MHIYSSTYKFKPLVFLAFLILYMALSLHPLHLAAQTGEQRDEYRFLDGLREYNAGSYDNAQQIFGELIAGNTKNDAVYYYSANIHLFRGETVKAAELMQKAVSLDPANYWYKSQLAGIYVSLGETEKAIAAYELLRKQYPRKTELYDALIEIYANNKQTDKAREIVDDIEHYLGKSEASGLTRYNLMIYENRQQEAFEFLKEFDKEWGTPRTATLIGDYYSGKQNDTLAMKYYSKALAMEPSYMPAIFGQAEIYRIRGQYDLYFRNMYLFMADKSVDPWMKSGYIKQIMSSQKFVQTFLPQMDTIMDNLYFAHPSDSCVAYPYARFKVQCGDLERGLEVLKENLKIYPESEDAQKEYLSIIYYMEMWDSLAAGASKALEMSRDNLVFLELKGIALAQLKKTGESIEIFKKMVTLSKGDSATYVRSLSILGDLNYQEGNKKEAFKYYSRTLKFEPEHVPALNNYAYYLSEDGKQLKKALAMSKKTIDAEPNNPTYLDTYAWILHLLGRDAEAKNILKRCMVYGGNENATILDHFAEVLFALKEYELASIYWGQADKLDPSLGLAAKAAEKMKNLSK